MPLLRGSPGRAGQGARGWVRRVVRRLAAATGAAARMAGAGAGQGSPAVAGQPGAAAPGDEEWRDWAGLPEDLLMKVAGKLVARTEAGWAAQLKKEHPRYWTEERIQAVMAERQRDGNCLFVFALVCKKWRKAQLKVGGQLCTRVPSDVIRPGSVALVKWALAEGCPRERHSCDTMAHCAALHGNLELVRWLCGEGGFTMDWGVMWGAARSGNLELVQRLCGEGGFAMDVAMERVMSRAAESGNLELVQWLRGEGCLWDEDYCHWAVMQGHVEVLRWVRKNGCEWRAETRDRAAAELGYTDNFGNLVQYSDDE